MFYSVKIIDSAGNVKHTISSKELSSIHWDNFKKSEEEITLTTSGKHAVPKWVRERIELEHPEYVDGICLY